LSLVSIRFLLGHGYGARARIARVEGDARGFGLEVLVDLRCIGVGDGARLRGVDGFSVTMRLIPDSPMMKPSACRLRNWASSTGARASDKSGFSA
jgi:hypothetical protein